MKATLTSWTHRWPPAGDIQIAGMNMVPDTERYIDEIRSWLQTSDAWSTEAEAEVTEAAWAVYFIDELAYEENKRRGGRPWKPVKAREPTLRDHSKREFKKALTQRLYDGCLEDFWNARNSIFLGNIPQAIRYAYFAGVISQRPMAYLGESFITKKSGQQDKPNKKSIRNQRFRDEADQMRATAKRAVPSDLALARKIRDSHEAKGETDLPSLETLRKIIAQK